MRMPTLEERRLLQKIQELIDKYDLPGVRLQSVKAGDQELWHELIERDHEKPDV